MASFSLLRSPDLAQIRVDLRYGECGAGRDGLHLCVELVAGGGEAFGLGHAVDDQLAADLLAQMRAQFLPGRGRLLFGSSSPSLAKLCSTARSTIESGTSTPLAATNLLRELTVDNPVGARLGIFSQPRPDRVAQLVERPEGAGGSRKLVVEFGEFEPLPRV